MNREDLCTFRPFLGRNRYGPICARQEADESVHSWPNERKRIGTHIWRHDAKDAKRISPVTAHKKPGPLARHSKDYLRGYNSGYQAAFRAALAGAFSEPSRA